MDALSACARIAARQHGVIGRAQALASGLSPDGIDRLIRAGDWLKRHRRVYALWVPEDRWLHRLMAGCLWLGSGSAVSLRAAAALLELDGFEAAALEFSTIGECRPGHGPEERQLLVHHVGDLPEGDLDVRANIPVTSAARTLVDLGTVAGPRYMQLAIESALRKGLTSLESLRQRRAELPAHSPKRGSVLWTLLDEQPAIATESALESLVWRLLLEEGLRPPERQHEVFGLDGRFVARLDFAYPREKVAIEADGYRFHSRPEDWQRDRRRQNELTALGWMVYRITWADVTRRPREVAREVAGLLTRRSAPPVRRDQPAIARAQRG